MEIKVSYRGATRSIHSDINSARQALNSLPTDYPSGISAVLPEGVYYESKNNSWSEWIPIQRFDKCDICGDRSLPIVGHERPCTSGRGHSHKSKELYPKLFNAEAFVAFQDHFKNYGLPKNFD